MAKQYRICLWTFLLLAAVVIATVHCHDLPHPHEHPHPHPHPYPNPHPHPHPGKRAINSQFPPAPMFARDIGDPSLP
ncbi:hypothetical protein SK128_008816 [Halocaridina rubra]|uniref:Uncharacterized protein n=1 Tax=Halocaridina rubra TaxID=373956 RepID=A0AAN8X6U2_HALRR